MRIQQMTVRTRSSYAAALNSQSAALLDADLLLLSRATACVKSRIISQLRAQSVCLDPLPWLIYFS
jgi:hypothetical protein